MKKFLYQNSLSIVFLLLFAGTLIGQVFFGLQEYNKELIEEGAAAVTMPQYLHSGHFIESTFENWESEFLQMGLFVWLTIFLRQKGSSESKGFNGPEEVDRKPSARRKDVVACKKRWNMAQFIQTFTYNKFVYVICLIVCPTYLR